MGRNIFTGWRNMESRLNYGNWIRKKLLVILGLCTIGVFALLFIPLGIVYRIFMLCVFLITAVSFFFPLYSYLMFSQKGGRFQEKVYQLIIQSLGESVRGRILDIGTGNGVLAVMLAEQHPEIEVIGIDYWGKDWEYSKSMCEKNAQIGEVENRVRFQKGDAAMLEFNDGTFDAAVSNLTFHEVRSVEDKREVVREALRVLKPGGKFAFVDYFYDDKRYGKPTDFNEFLHGLRLSHFETKTLYELIALPVIMRHPKIFGKVGIIHGRK